MSGGTGEGPRRVGRPRADQLRPDSGRPPREELLCAAAELFTVRGYAATTTRAVAERAGMRQATMYHYFGGKEELLAELLESTVAPSLALSRRLLGESGRPAARRLWELCRSDVLLLCGGPYNLGALYLLPELRGQRFAQFRRMREELRDSYRVLLAGTRVGAELAGDRAALTLRNDLVFGLIEGVMLIRRSDPARPVAAFAEAAADAALRIAGITPPGPPGPLPIPAGPATPGG
ncbi:TetR/AcrR family transcriptional regulator [Streptomyces sp. NBC_00091]|uniref:TetR/AcrR family transcriptional regulator n=1 Tax=Streptomyces sp. NBC_00091 TaxID=2975648 RepID=UPI00225B653F|nr:TetR/AcrR family transcriptional regulator [Streptomyces sp. NBC_00091]MCX5379304.1 TetR/AcrR family transcriptional regulator [Streptomyces sp. NBC_00091]